MKYKVIPASGPAYYVKTQTPVMSRRALIRLTLASMLCLALLVSGTLAYLSQVLTEQVNAFDFGEVGIEVWEPDPYNWSTKEVYLKNTGEVPGVVRAMLIPVLKGKDGGTVVGWGGTGQSMSEPVGNDIVIGDFTFHLDGDWRANWFYKDGFFYYRHVLKPGFTTDLLLESVSLTVNDEYTQAKYKDVKIEIEVMADIIQIVGDAPDEWGVSVLEGNVTPKP